ncbi:hypothetical protein L798_06997 [Zootermopsis nevadensis]|uniref:Gustatory receptor n=1 Tax=Zootermopsis nevadensis TaxID=136037 RepID=A0A067R709_ZOONE|nr:hypothetical protein L798_06997 [Zootermopsis nevadensis]
MEHISPVEDVHIQLKPLLTISRIFGLTHFSLTRTRKGEGLAMNFNFLDVVLVCMWISAYFTLACFSVYELMGKTPLPGKITILLIINIISIHSTTIVTLITSASLNRRKLPRALSKLIEVDRMVGHRDVTNSTRTKLKTMIHIFILLLSQVFIYAVNYYIKCEGTLASVIYVTFQNLGITFNILITIVYADLIRTLKLRYKYMIDDLEEYFRVKDNAVIVNFRDQHVTFSSGIIRCKQHPLFSITRRNVSSDLREIRKIHTLRFIYIELYDSIMLLNSYFGIPILFEMLSVMLTCVTAMYVGSYCLSVGHNFFKTRILGYYLMSFGILFLSTFAWLNICCHALIEEANRGIISIQRITAFSNVNCETVRELDRLSNQMNNMKVQFTACGFISLGLPIICTVIGGILTYILIMVQIA